MTLYSALGAGWLCLLLRFLIIHNLKIWISLLLKEYKEVADKMKFSMTSVALAWINTKPFIASILLGFTKLSNLKEDVKVFRVK